MPPNAPVRRSAPLECRDCNAFAVLVTAAADVVRVVCHSTPPPRVDVEVAEPYRLVADAVLVLLVPSLLVGLLLLECGRVPGNPPPPVPGQTGFVFNTGALRLLLLLLLVGDVVDWRAGFACPATVGNGTLRLALG
jgi:hypothetical protein